MSSSTLANTAQRPDLYFALVRPTGCAGEEVIAALRAELTRVGYGLRAVIKVSALLHTIERYAKLATFEGSEEDRISKHMDAGDKLRRDFSDGGVLAYLAAEAIANSRSTSTGSTAWVVDSLKHTREVEVLRELYGEQLVVISIYADQAQCEAALTRSISRSHGAQEGAAERARELIKRDRDGTDINSFGQDVRRTFPLGDYFVSTTQDVRKQIARCVETLFGRPTRSPSRDEYAMAVARSSALRSADLSRQVGAVIVDGDGEVVVAGCNEVPKPDGGVYWEGDALDKRDFQLGYDPNEATSREMLIELFGRMKTHKWLSASALRKGPTKLARLAKKERVLEKARVTSLVEFGRIVHAEMNAVLRAASSGVNIRGMRMICTTFPCHVCARHLLGAGISEVVYIEPYPKSLAPEQYPDAIVVGERPAPHALRLCPFLGWSPSRYMRIFEFGSRKDDTGYLQVWEPRQARPRTPDSDGVRPEVERDMIERLKDILSSVGISRVTTTKKKPSTRRAKRTPTPIQRSARRKKR